MTHTHGGTDAPECTTCTPITISEDAKVVYAMICTANSVGHALPWANLTAYSPIRSDERRYRVQRAVDELLEHKWIIAGPEGLRALL
jgi:hypothetical protein